VWSFTYTVAIRFHRLVPGTVVPRAFTVRLQHGRKGLYALLVFYTIAKRIHFLKIGRTEHEAHTANVKNMNGFLVPISTHLDDAVLSNQNGRSFPNIQSFS
jgi:hypothetical protein